MSGRTQWTPAAKVLDNRRPSADHASAAITDKAAPQALNAGGKEVRFSTFCRYGFKTAMQNLNILFDRLRVAMHAI